jgi:lysozyme
MILGIDVSRWQGEVDWPAVVQAGAEFAYIRSSILHAEDEQFQRNADLCNLPRGFYHFLSEYGSPESQADIFCDLIENLRWELRPVVDCENHTDPNHIIPFMNLVEQRMGVAPMIYTGAWWWNPNVGNQPIYAAYDLWIALWNDVGTGNPLLIEPCPPWIEWTFWQWSADGNGRGPEFGLQHPDADLDYFHGDVLAFRAYMDHIHTERYGETLESRVSALEAGLSDLRNDVALALSVAQDIVLGE